MTKALIAGLSAAALLMSSTAAMAQTVDECEQLVYGPAGAPKTSEPAPATPTTPAPAPAPAPKPEPQPQPSTNDPVRVIGSNGNVGGQPVVVKGPTVNTGGLSPEMKAIMDDIYRTAQDLGMRVPVITSARDSTHKDGSLHYSGNAVDLRCNVYYAAPSKCEAWAKELRRVLGPKYDVIFETFGAASPNNHIHIEFDP